jgi:CheY-like chemotaxis protein
MEFQLRHINRISFPKKHILICEDDLNNQVLAAGAMRRVFDAQGEVVFSFVSGGVAAAAIMMAQQVDLVLLDHDMPIGNGIDLITWMAEADRKIPIITFSGIPQNNANMTEAAKTAGIEVFTYGKFDVIAGWADGTMVSILRR